MKIKLYHRTSTHNAKLILERGFHDGEGQGFEPKDASKVRGVFLSNRPLDANEGVLGDVVLEVIADLPRQALREIKEPPPPEGYPARSYREFSILADTLNGRCKVRALKEDELSSLEETLW